MIIFFQKEELPPYSNRFECKGDSFNLDAKISQPYRDYYIFKKNPQETTDVTPVDSVVKFDSLSNESSQSLLPYLKASLPLKSIRINSKYGMRKHPVMHKTIMHNGVDLAAHYEKVFSMLPGEVIGVGQDFRSGKYVMVRTGGYTISYCHPSSFG